MRPRQSQYGEEWASAARAPNPFDNENRHGRSGRGDNYGRSRAPDSERPPVKSMWAAHAEPRTSNPDHAYRATKEPSISSQLFGIDDALKRHVGDDNATGELRRPGPSQRRIGAAIGRSTQPAQSQSLSRPDPALSQAPSEPQVWRPMGGGLPRRSPHPTMTTREPRVREPHDDARAWRPGGPAGRQSTADPRISRERRSVGDPEEPQEFDVEAAILPDAKLPDEVEGDWRRRKASGDQNRDRRARLFEVEEDEPLQVSRTAKLPTARKSGGSRGSSPGFDFDPDLAEEFLGEGKRRRKRKGKQASATPQTPKRPEITLPEFISVEKLAQGLKVRLAELLAKLEEEGFEGARYDNVLDSSTSAMFAEIYGFEPVVKTIDDSGDIFPRPPAEDPLVLPPRPPIVTIMGHVDHGKTTILDYFRKANVVASEHGGITQHIGAFSVTMPGSERNITFLDTPGHAAFLEMRRRGAVVTDIVVLVVAADDSVKAQTKEAIKHAREAGVQMIIAINKVDKPEADVEQVKLDLIQHDVVVEDHGGEYQAIPVSGKTGRGMDDLEEAILTLADVADFRAENDGPAEGWIIESRVGATGRVATVLVRRGTLRPGDFIVAGTTWARIRTLRNDAGELIEEAPLVHLSKLTVGEEMTPKRVSRFCRQRMSSE